MPILFTAEFVVKPCFQWGNRCIIYFWLWQFCVTVWKS